MSKAQHPQAAANPRHIRQQMVELLPHEDGRGAETEVGLEKEFSLLISEVESPAVMLLLYTPEKFTLGATSINAYFEHMASQSWPSASAFAHAVAGDLYDHALPHSLTLHLDIEHDGLVESFEVKHAQPKYLED